MGFYCCHPETGTPWGGWQCQKQWTRTENDASAQLQLSIDGCLSAPDKGKPSVWQWSPAQGASPRKRGQLPTAVFESPARKASTTLASATGPQFQPRWRRPVPDRHPFSVASRLWLQATSPADFQTDFLPCWLHRHRVPVGPGARRSWQPARTEGGGWRVSGVDVEGCPRASPRSVPLGGCNVECTHQNGFKHPW